MSYGGKGVFKIYNQEGMFLLDNIVTGVKKFRQLGDLCEYLFNQDSENMLC